MKKRFVSDEESGLLILNVSTPFLRRCHRTLAVRVLLQWVVQSNHSLSGAVASPVRDQLRRHHRGSCRPLILGMILDWRVVGRGLRFAPSKYRNSLRTLARVPSSLSAWL